MCHYFVNHYACGHQRPSKPFICDSALASGTPCQQFTMLDGVFLAEKCEFCAHCDDDDDVEAEKNGDVKIKNKKEV